MFLRLIQKCAPVLLLISCGSNGRDNHDDQDTESQGSGGAQDSGSGGSLSVDRVDLPNAPGPYCSENGVCDANLAGTWTISDRCDRTGTLSIQSDCGSTASAAWQ